MLVDSGADVSLIADDLLPAGTKRETPIPVEGVGKNAKLYDTAQVPITIQGTTKMVQVAIAPTADIPYGVILGNNIPDTQHTWKWQIGQDKPAAVFAHPADDKQSSQPAAPGGAGERARQVVQEKATCPGAQNQLTAHQPSEQQPVAQYTVHQFGLQPTDSQQQQVEHCERQDPTQEPAIAAVITRRQAAANRDKDSQVKQRKPLQDKVFLKTPFSVEGLIKSQQQDQSLKEAWDKAKEPLPTEYKCKKGILYRAQQQPHPLENPYKIVVPEDLKQHVLELGHQKAGHFGVKKTLQLIQEHFHWNRMGADVATHCKKCTTCAVNKRHKQQKQPLQPIPLVHQPWSKLAIDIIGPFEKTTSGNIFALTLVDMATRFPMAVYTLEED